MESQEKLKRIIKAYHDYTDFWAPRAVIGHSYLVPLGMRWFCESLLISDVNKWWNMYLKEFIEPGHAKDEIKQFVLNLVRYHNCGFIDLDKLELHNPGHDSGGVVPTPHMIKIM